MKPYKFGVLRDDIELPFTYANIYALQKTTGPNRLIIAPSKHYVQLLIDLTRELPEPFDILYILLVSRRSGREPGRYQSPPLSSRQEMEVFLNHFYDYFESDGRHHIWVTSLPISATLVYDNHNVLYAYGPFDKFKRILTKHGLSEKKVQFPVPHTHNYNPQFDISENEIMAYWNWEYFPLTENDDA